MSKKNYITIYAEDYTSDIWKMYCNAANVFMSATYITVFFKPEDVKSDEEEEETY